MSKCNNCGTSSDGKYCFECGQKLEFKRLDLKALLTEKFHHFFHWENTVLYTFRHMLTSPGKTVKEYITGSRRKIVKPFKYFIAIQTAHVLIYYLLSGNYFAYMNSGMNLSDPSSAQTINLQNAIVSNIKYFDYLIPIFFSLFLFLFFKKKTGINFAESFAVSLYFTGTNLLFTILFILLSLIDIRIWNYIIIINFLYLVFAFSDFTGSRKTAGVLANAGLVVSGYFAYLAFVISVLYAYFGIF